MADGRHKRGGNKGIARARKEQRRAEAEARQEKRNAIPHHHQLGVLKRRPGNSLRERRRLRKLVGGRKHARNKR